MTLLVFLVYAFINTFGITQPSPEAARRAARWLGVLLLVLGLLFAGVMVDFRGFLRRS